MKKLVLIDDSTHKVVPIEPTKAMMTAMYHARDKWPSQQCDNMAETVLSFAEPRWHAALSNAPEFEGENPAQPVYEQRVPVAELGGNELLQAIETRHFILQKDIGDAARNMSQVGLLPALVEELAQLSKAKKALLKSRTYQIY